MINTEINTSKDIAITISNMGFAYTAQNRSDVDEVIYRDFSLQIESGTALALMGASGSGKSTLARLMAGMDSPNSGVIERSPTLLRRHDVVYVDQNPFNSVFPWLSVMSNLDYPLRKLGWENSAIIRRRNELLQMFHLSDVKHSLPAKLSGGEVQRLAIARCISWSPRVLILDETFSALDRKTKSEIQDVFRRVLADEAITLVLATHNVGDVMTLCSRCVVLGERPVRSLADLDLQDPSDRARNADLHRQVEESLMRMICDGTI